MTTHMTPSLRSYDLAAVDQLEQPPTTTDLDPIDPGARAARDRLLAFDATIYGLPSAFQYPQMYEQTTDRNHPGFTGFNVFRHQRDIATPDFDAFKTPNVDTLYSNAWLDLTGGPAIVTIPPIPDRYYTLQFVDMYSNSTNLSSRTVGPGGGRFAVVAAGRIGEPAPDGALFRVATPYVWILMRILVDGSTSDLELVRGLQDAVTVDAAPAAGPGVDMPPVSFDQVQTDAAAFLTALDWTIRHNGAPVQEAGLVARYRAIGIGGDEPFDLDRCGADQRVSIETGFDDAMRVIAASRSQVGERGETGWSTGTAGDLGFAYLRRAVQNFVGTGGNVAAEKKFFVTFHDADAIELNGDEASYSMTFDELPPVDGHWSLTVYPQATGLLMPNEIDRYAIAANTPGLRHNADGSLTISLQHRRPERPENWLPVPAAAFYVDLRLWEPRRAAQDGSWLPPPIVRQT
jgi:hypothetical protein